LDGKIEMKEHSKYHYSKNKHCSCGKLITNYAECCSICGNKLLVKKRRSYDDYNNPNYKGGLPKCIDCGKKLSSRKNKRCRKCSNTGRNNGNYKHGDCIKWKEIRKLIFKRDNYICQKCYKKENSYLNCHHIIHHNYCDNKFDLNNLITLCKDCHRYISNIELTDKYIYYKNKFKK
jgi:5-methylcytosine-specific restriction endonuclease McrA